MKKFLFGWLAVWATMLMSSVQASAVISLAEFAFNIDGAVSNGAAPAGVNIAGFNTSSGLGSISVKLSGAGNRYAGLFVDHEIDETVNTFFNESGSSSGIAAAGQGWEIDEPGFTFGNIYGNFLAGQLDGLNGVPAGSEDDVSMATDWHFALNAGETATISFLFSDIAPVGGFYLKQFDPDSQAAIYMSSSLLIEQDGHIPEPASLGLVGLGLLAALASSRRLPASAPAR
ncbi:PEP-CTERM sorting domain-containing protein [Paucibacter sp. B2R-40]|uniref:PEP-CTERM sorting domain-containing protein n=1 Tax=Paucibacter sp. B2R-40 TaxID=2893554 RepID=UPI0021E45896|nr:PEP-CTERM sorting domain-containing protein [Paucibacter sp. B2R-40]MCV2355639.1 PEP-CTERM sorting domain-containing protein [Paucibacter sp. B2R-40]